MKKILQVLKKARTAIRQHPKRMIGMLLVFAIVFAEAGGLSVLLKDTFGAIVPGNVITNHSFETPPPGGPIDVTNEWGQSIDKIPWNIQQKAGYDQAYTQTKSKEHNGTATTNHVVVTADTIKLFGYGKEPYHNEATVSGVTAQSVQSSLFTTRLNFHNFKETGMYFGSYKIALRADEQEGSTASLLLLDAGGNVLATYMTGIQKLSQQRIDIRLQTSGSNVQVYINGVLRGSVATSMSGKFGFYADYFYHDCPELSIMQWDNVELSGVTYLEPGNPNPPQEEARVRFMLKNTTTELAPAHTRTGYIGQQYKIDIPGEIDGYTYVGNSRNNMVPLDPLTYGTDKETILYYFGPKVRIEYYVNGTVRWSHDVPMDELAVDTPYSHTAPAAYDKDATYDGAELTSVSTLSFTPTEARPEGVLRYYYIKTGLTIQYRVNGSVVETIVVPSGDLPINQPYVHTAPSAIGANTITGESVRTFTPTLSNPIGTMVFDYSIKPGITKTAKVWHAATGVIDTIDPGTAASPVKVEVGDYIRYYLTVDIDKTYRQKWTQTGTKPVTVDTSDRYMNGWGTNTEFYLNNGGYRGYIQDFAGNQFKPTDFVWFGSGSALLYPTRSEPTIVNLKKVQIPQLSSSYGAGPGVAVGTRRIVLSFYYMSGSTEVEIFSHELTKAQSNTNAEIPLNLNVTVPAGQRGFMRIQVLHDTTAGDAHPCAIGVDHYATLWYSYESTEPIYGPDPNSPLNRIYDAVPFGLSIENGNSNKFGADSAALLFPFAGNQDFSSSNPLGAASNYFTLPLGDLLAGKRTYFFDVKVNIASTVNVNDVFDNQAALRLFDYQRYSLTGEPIGGGTQTEVRSNHTYHSTEDPPPPPQYFKVTERYLDYATNTSLNPDFVLNGIEEGSSYSHTATATDDIPWYDTAYEYYGYSIDGGPLILGEPPSPTLWDNIDSDCEVIFYYLRPPVITESYWQYDPDSGGPTTDWIGKVDYTETLEYGGDYDVLSTYGNRVPYGGYTYSYVGYDSGSGYTPGNPPSPALTNVTSDTEVKLYYRRDPVVIVEFRKWDAPATADPFAPTKQTVTTNVTRGDDYTLSSTYLSGFNALSTDWNYKGYSLGASNTPIAGNPPANPLFTNVQVDQRIVLYFLDSPMVTTHFVEYGNPYNYLKDDHGVLVEKGDNYTTPTSMLSPVTPEGSSKVYTYVGYTITSPTGDVSQVIQGPPPNPTITNIQNDVEITLYYMTKYEIIVKYHEHNDAFLGDHVYTELLPVETLEVEGGSAYTGLSAATVPSPLFDGSNRFDRRSRYKWATDTNAENTGTPTIAAVWGDQTIIYTYTKGTANTGHAIVEQWREYGMSSHILKADTSGTVANNANFNLAALTPSFTEGGTTYYYVGYEIDGGAIIFADPPSSLNNVDDSHTVRYLYTKAGVVEQFREDGNLTNVLAPNELVEIASGSPYNSPTWINGSSFIKDGKTYNIVGYQIDGGTKVYGTIPSELIASVDGFNVVTYLYREEVPEKKMHLRQVIIDPVSGVPIHYTGYFELENDGVIRSVTTDSNVDGISVDYRDFLVDVSDTDDIYLINNIVPQYYYYAGYVATKTDSAHDPSARVTTQAQVDFDESGEWWVTVYIKPRNTPPGQHEWGFITNDFGILYPAP